MLCIIIIIIGASLDIPRLIVRPVERRVVALQSLIQELTASWVAPALLWQRALGHLASFVDLDSGDQGSVGSLGVSGSSSGRETFLPPPPSFPIADLRCLPVRLGCDSPTSSGFRHLVRGGVLGPYQFSRTQGSFLALKSLEVHVRGRSLLIRSDNTTVVSYINYQGGTHSPSLCLLAIELWEWCLRRGIHFSAAHIPGEDNLVADFLSRGKFLPSEWTLNPLIFQRICQVLVSQPEMDLFVSTLNFQLPKYCARYKDPQTWKVDALSFRWSGLPLYAFPPFSILPTVLEKIAQEGADVALVAPFWPQRPWFPNLLSLLAGRPRILPLQKDLVFQPMSRQPHPRLESLHLSLWPLSGRKEGRRAFLLELQISQQKLLESPHELLTFPSGMLFQVV